LSRSPVTGPIKEATILIAISYQVRRSLVLRGTYSKA
jgi:hypothetical protein